MRIGARGSDLAQAQARMIESHLNAAGFKTEMIIISTLGDRIQDVPLNQLGAQGVFTKEIEEALYANKIDLAVHSFKDVATLQPDGLKIVAVTERENCADLLIIRPDKFNDSDEFIKIIQNGVVGTSAVRRSTQIKALRPDLQVKDLRGNVPTRLDKLYQGYYDAIILANAGVNRLGLNLSAYKVVRLEPEMFVPSPGQGALAIEMRSDDPFIPDVKKILNHEMTAEATVIERALLTKFGGGCSLPLGAWASRVSNEWMLYAFWGGSSKPAWTMHSGTDELDLVERAYKALMLKGG